MFNTGPSQGMMQRRMGGGSRIPARNKGPVAGPMGPDMGGTNPPNISKPMPMMPPGGLMPKFPGMIPPTSPMGPDMGGTMPLLNRGIPQGPNTLPPYTGSDPISMPIPQGGPVNPGQPPLGIKFGGIPNGGSPMPDQGQPLWKRYLMMAGGGPGQM